MLIKLDNVKLDTNHHDASYANIEDKLHNRIKQDQEEQQSSNKLKYLTNNNKERILNKTTSHLEITEVKPYLLLCGAIAIQGNVLEDLQIGCVINATIELPDTPLPNSLQNDILYLRVNIEDKPECDILSWLDMVTDIIHQVKSAGGKTLIHCVAGISRSATLCIAYLIKYEGYSLHDSYVMLKGMRKIIRPNSGFFGQLVKFEKRLTGKETVLMVHSDFTQSWIPQLYEEDYMKWYTKKCRKV